jgi:hypothetical protein
MRNVTQNTIKPYYGLSLQVSDTDVFIRQKKVRIAGNFIIRLDKIITCY